MDKDRIILNEGPRKKLGRPLSIWHWSNVLIILSLLITVLLVKTIFQTKENIPLIQNELGKKGIIISLDEAKSVAKIYTHKLWEWHVYFGYVLVGLFLLRIILELFQIVDQKFFKILKGAHKYLHQTNEKQKVKHFIFVRYIYLLYYLTLTLMVSTGLFIKFSENYPNLKPTRSTVKDIHTVGMYIILAYIILHLAGLLLSELRKKGKSFLF